MKTDSIIKLILGVAFMIGGMYVYKNVEIQFLKDLEAQGVPLNPGKTLAAIGVLLILFPVLNSFFITPLKEAIDGRTTELEKTFSEAETLRADMGKMKTEYEARLAETEASARAQIQEEIRKAQEMRQSLMAEAGQYAEQLKKRAEEEIKAERDRVITDLRLNTVNLALGATQKILGENVDNDRNRKLIEEFIEKAEVPA